MEKLVDKRGKPFKLMLRTANVLPSSRAFHKHTTELKVSRVANVVTRVHRTRAARRTLLGYAKSPPCLQPSLSRTRSWQLKRLHRYIVGKAERGGVRHKVVNQVNNTIQYLESVRTTKDTVSSDPTQMYLQDVSHKTLLTREQEYKIAVLIKQGNEEAKQIMIESNLRLVIKIAKGYMNRGVGFMDLIEEGNLGLMHAVDKFEPEKGFRFSTYATWWIRQNIERAIMCHSTNVRMPVHLRKEMNVYSRAANTLAQQLDHDPTYEEISDFLGRPVESVRRVMELKIRESSIDVPMSDDSSETVADNLVDPEEVSDPSEITEQEDLKAHMHGWLCCLDKLEKKVLTLRYGLDEAIGVMTLDEVGAKLGLTRERVRQVQMTALKKLHHHLTEQGFDGPFAELPC